MAARLCSVLLGPSRHFWVHKHQKLHHRQPNVLGWDDDLETRGFLRFSPARAWEDRFHRQEMKAPLIYAMNTLEWLFWKDFSCLASGRLNKWHSVDLSSSEKGELLVCKVLYFLVFMLPPFLVLPVAWSVAAFVLFHACLPDCLYATSSPCGSRLVSQTFIAGRIMSSASANSNLCTCLPAASCTSMQ